MCSSVGFKRMFEGEKGDREGGKGREREIEDVSITHLEVFNLPPVSDILHTFS